MTSKTIIRNLKRLEKVMVWMLELPVENNIYVAEKRADLGETLICLNNYMHISRVSGACCGCVDGFYEAKTGRKTCLDFSHVGIITFSKIFGFYKSKGDTVRSRLAIVRKLIKKYERDQ